MKLEGVTGIVKKVMRTKKITQADIAEHTETNLTTVKRNLAKPSITTDTLIAYADILGCDVALIDRATGEIYR